MPRPAALLLSTCLALACTERTADGTEPIPTVATVERSCGSRAGAAPTVTLPALLGEMTDVLRLATANLGERSYLASSADPRPYDPTGPESRAPGGWLGNTDRGQFLYRTRTAGRIEDVMLDVTGPGAITRLWSANPKGVLRVYLDCERTPVLEAPFADLLAGRVAPLNGPFAYVVASGGNLYFPIPFQHGARVTVEDGESPYYHINYRLYPVGTAVEPFDTGALTRYADDIEAAREALLDPARSLPSGLRTVDERLSLGPDPAELVLTASDSTGGAVVRQLRVQPSRTSADVRRQVLVTITFDGHETVRAPLGDLFATTPAAGTHQSLLASFDGASFTTRFPMPFREQALLRFEPGTIDPVDLDVTVALEDAPVSDDTLRFHAKWRDSGELPTERIQELRVIALEGRGAYLGNSLDVDTPSDAWWGEGDEIVHVDSSPVPAWLGTGTEDYYGYAWGSRDLFSRPYHAQTIADPETSMGPIGLYRWHVLDAIPFAESLTFDLEVWHWDRDTTLRYGVVNFWYATPATTDDTPPVEVGDLE